MHQQAFAGLHEAAACQRDQREGAQARASRPLLAVPADRDGEREGRRQRQKMNAYLKSALETKASRRRWIYGAAFFLNASAAEMFTAGTPPFAP